jgi:hypothetical protein
VGTPPATSGGWPAVWPVPTVGRWRCDGRRWSALLWRAVAMVGAVMASGSDGRLWPCMCGGGRRCEEE